MHSSVMNKCLLLLSCTALSVAASARDNAHTATVQKALQQHISFIENKGQVTDAEYRTSSIDYSLKTPGMSVLVENGALHYQFFKQHNTLGNNYDVYRMDVQLVNANTSAAAMPSAMQPYYETYMQPYYNAAGIRAHAYDRITYKNVYPNIDWVLYIKDNTLEYDFVVHAGGNPKDIQLKYDGATNMRTTPDGRLTAYTPMGSVTENSPYSYEQKSGKKIASAFVLRNNLVSFDVAPYAGTLIIDPTINWASYYGGSANDQILSTTIDANGNIFATGTTASTTNIAAGGVGQTTIGGGTDVFVLKVNSLGQRQWATYYGGTGDDQGKTIACDKFGNIYVSGSTNSANGMTTGTNNHQNTFGGGSTDGFIAKFGSIGQVLWATYYGGNGADQANGIACDTAANVYICGSSTTTTAGVIATTNGHQSVLTGSTDAFVAKFNATGQRQWATYYGGNLDDMANQLTCDVTGNVYVAGHTNSISAIATAGSSQVALGGMNDGFLVKFSGAGIPQWGTYFGGNANDQAAGVACDKQGNIYLAGITSSNGLATTSAHQTTQGGVSDAFVAKYSPAGQKIWATYYGGPLGDNANAIVCDAQGSVLIAGTTSSTTGIATADAYQTTLNGASDAFVAKFTPDGVRKWGAYYGGPSNENGNAIVCNTSGIAFLGGLTVSSSGIALGTAMQNTYGGLNDGLLVAFAPDTSVAITQPYLDTVVCAGATNISVPYTVYNAFRTGNTFAVQLSDANGSFASPTTISTPVTSTTSGTLTATIPGGTLAGTGYRIRIISTNPVMVSSDNGWNIKVLAALPTPIAGSNSPVCAGNTLNLTANSTATGVTYNWSGPSTFSSTTQNPSITAVTGARAGTYSVTISRTGCTTSPAGITTVAIGTIVPEKPTVSVQTPVCAIDTIRLSASSTTPAVSYSWTGPNMFTSNNQNPKIPNAQLIMSGQYKVVATLNGCVSPADSVLVTVGNIVTPSISVYATPSDTVCAGELITFKASITNGGSNPKYQWMNTGVPIVGATASTYSSAYLNNGNLIYCVLRSSATCATSTADSSNKVRINIKQAINPAVVITATPGVIVPLGTTITFRAFPSDAGTTPTYQWQVNGMNVDGATADTYITDSLQYNDSVQVILNSSATNCTTIDFAVSNVLVMKNPTGVNSVASHIQDMVLYPNPAKDAIWVKGNVHDAVDQTISIEILNTLGQVVYTTNAAVQNGSFSHNIHFGTSLPAGIYMLRLDVAGNKDAARFIVQ